MLVRHVPDAAACGELQQRLELLADARLHGFVAGCLGPHLDSIVLLADVARHPDDVLRVLELLP